MEAESREHRPEEQPAEHALPEGVGAQIEEHVRRTRLAGLFLQSPSFMAVTRGPEHVFVNANPTYRDLVGGRDLMGRSAREAFPELEEQEFIALLDRVYETGEPYVGSEEPARLRRPADGEGAGRLETVWVSYSYHPLRDRDGNVSGILHHGIDITGRVELRRELKRRVRQEAAVGELGRFALQSERPSDVFRRAVETAREVLDGAGYGEAFSHSTGHGLGLEVHEAPRLHRTSSERLVAGHVLTVEPGAYLADRGGVRIEDDVAVEAGGTRRLTTFSRELMEL
jgi:PAS domain S-box-containing protein